MTASSGKTRSTGRGRSGKSRSTGKKSGRTARCQTVIFRTSGTSGRFTAGMRIKSSLVFASVFRRGIVVADQTLVLHAQRSPAASQLGLSISKKVGHAPTRNRWKRLIREAFRLQHASLPDGLQMVVRPKKGGVPEFHAICHSLATLAKRADKKL